MPPLIGTESFHITEYAKASDDFHLAFGRALGQWAVIEERLSLWFWYATGMPYSMARAMFFAPRTFSARTDLLEAALKYGTIEPPEALEFIKQATNKAGKYSSFRNQLAHGEQTFDVRKDAPTFKQVILISGKHHPIIAANNAVTIARLEVATANYREVARLLMDVHEFLENRSDPTLPGECLRQLNELPNQVDSPKPSQNS